MGEPAEGDASETVMLKLARLAVSRSASVTVMLRPLDTPLTVGVPVIAPVEVLKLSPVGSVPVRLKT